VSVQFSSVQLRHSVYAFRRAVRVSHGDKLKSLAELFTVNEEEKAVTLQL